MLKSNDGHAISIKNSQISYIGSADPKTPKEFDDSAIKIMLLAARSDPSMMPPNAIKIGDDSDKKTKVSNADKKIIQRVLAEMNQQDGLEMKVANPSWDISQSVSNLFQRARLAAKELLIPKPAAAPEVHAGNPPPPPAPSGLGLPQTEPVLLLPPPTAEELRGATSGPKEVQPHEIKRRFNLGIPANVQASSELMRAFSDGNLTTIEEYLNSGHTDVRSQPKLGKWGNSHVFEVRVPFDNNDHSLVRAAWKNHKFTLVPDNIILKPLSNEFNVVNAVPFKSRRPEMARTNTTVLAPSSDLS